MFGEGDHWTQHQRVYVPYPTRLYRDRPVRGCICALCEIFTVRIANVRARTYAWVRARGFLTGAKIFRFSRQSFCEFRCYNRISTALPKNIERFHRVSSNAKLSGARSYLKDPFTTHSKHCKVRLNCWVSAFVNSFQTYNNRCYLIFLT